jgi:hypothetical protein
VLLCERAQDPDGELGRAAALDQLDQRVQVVTLVSRQLPRYPSGEATADELGHAPAHELSPLVPLSQFGLHIFLVCRPNPVLTPA